MASDCPKVSPTHTTLFTWWGWGGREVFASWIGDEVVLSCMHPPIFAGLPASPKRCWLRSRQSAIRRTKDTAKKTLILNMPVNLHPLVPEWPPSNLLLGSAYGPRMASLKYLAMTVNLCPLVQEQFPPISCLGLTLPLVQEWHP